MPLSDVYFWQEIEKFSLSAMVCIVYDGLLTAVILSIELLFLNIVLA
jgi:hypothetical protein